MDMHRKSCAVDAFTDEQLLGEDLLIDDGSIDWDWDKDDGGCLVDPDVIQLPKVEGSSESDADFPRETKRQCTNAASTDDHSDMLPRIHATIESLIAGEKIVQQIKADALTRLADTLANYETMLDDVIRCIGDTRVRVKDEIRGVFECAVKRLDGQIDELAVSIGQLAGLAATNGSSYGFKFESLLEPFLGPVCCYSIGIPDTTSQLQVFLKQMSAFTATDMVCLSLDWNVCLLHSHNRIVYVF